MFERILDQILTHRLCCSCHNGRAASLGLCIQCEVRLPTQVQQIRRPNCEFVYPLWGLMPYEGAGGAIVRSIKSRGDLWQAKHLSDHLANAVTCLPCPDAVIAIPSTPNRHFKRGFNLAEVLASAIAKALAVPHYPSALRRIDMGVQAHRSQTARREMLSQRFECRHNALPEHLLVVDDVHTSGGTLDAAALALLTQAGRVSGLALTSRQL